MCLWYKLHTKLAAIDLRHGKTVSQKRRKKLLTTTHVVACYNFFQLSSACSSNIQYSLDDFGELGNTNTTDCYQAVVLVLPGSLQTARGTKQIYGLTGMLLVGGGRARKLNIVSVHLRSECSTKLCIYKSLNIREWCLWLLYTVGRELSRADA